MKRKSLYSGPRPPATNAMYEDLNHSGTPVIASSFDLWSRVTDVRVFTDSEGCVAMPSSFTGLDDADNRGNTFVVLRLVAMTVLHTGIATTSNQGDCRGASISIANLSWTNVEGTQFEADGVSMTSIAMSLGELIPGDGNNGKRGGGRGTVSMGSTVSVPVEETEEPGEPGANLFVISLRTIHSLPPPISPVSFPSLLSHPDCFDGASATFFHGLGFGWGGMFSSRICLISLFSCFMRGLF